jgi:hypothetical protein
VEEKLLSATDLLEGVHVALANFLDTLIDYPMSKEYAFAMFERLGTLGVMQKIDSYKQHVEMLLKEEEDNN